MRGRHPRPRTCQGRRRHRASHRAGGKVSRHRRRRRKGGRGMALLAGGAPARTRSGQGHRRLRGRRYRGSPPGRPASDRGHRRSADGRHERGRRPVRIRQDVPAAGRQICARHEEGRRPPAPLYRGGEGEERIDRGQGQGRDGHRQGRRPRHRQEHRRRGPAVQRLRGHRPGRDGAVAGDPAGGGR